MEYLSNGIAFFKPSRFGRLVRVFRGEANLRRIRDFRLSTLRYALGSSRMEDYALILTSKKRTIKDWIISTEGSGGG